VLQAMGRGINLGNVYDHSSGNNASFDAQRQRIDTFKSLGFKHLRVPVTWGDTFNLDDEKTQTVSQVVRYALQRGLYVILNTHHEGWLKHHYDGSDHYNNRFWSLWHNIATLFKDEGPSLAFEVLNEPDGAMGGWAPGHRDPFDGWALDLTRRINFVGWDAIRQVSPERVVLVMPNGMGQHQMARHVYPNRESLPASGQDRWLGVSVHTYEPWDFCGESGSNSRFGDIGAMQGFIDSNHRDTVNWHYSTGIPVHVGEYGVGRRPEKEWERNTDLVREYYKFITNYFQDRGWPTSVWDDQGWFAIMYRDQLLYGLAEKVLERY